MEALVVRPVWIVVTITWLAATLSVCSSHSNIWRKTLEKELFHSSIKYLRDQLLVCLKSTDGLRGKRKADLDTAYWLAEMELQMDLDILQNTQTYLMDRVIHCRRKLDHTKGSVPGANPLGLEKMFMSKMDMKYYSTSAKLQNVARDMAPHWVESPAQEAEIPTKPEITTTDAPTPKLEVVLDDRRVTCSEVMAKRGTLQCLDLRVDDFQRLPNKDFCPPTYEANRWRPAADMPSRTRDVLDVINLCAVIGQKLNVPGYSKGASVVWGCTDQIKSRLKWQNSRWAGRVEDNGYLRDLQCVYSADVTLPLT